MEVPSSFDVIGGVCKTLGKTSHPLIWKWYCGPRNDLQGCIHGQRMACFANGSGIVGGTTGLGLKKTVMMRSAQGLLPNANIIHRPKVILRCAVKQVLSPPSSGRQKKRLLQGASTAADGRN